MSAPKVTKPGASSTGNILTALRTMSKATGPNQGNATPNRNVAPTAPTPTLPEQPPVDTAPESAPSPTSTQEVALPLASLGGTIRVGDRISLTVTRVVGGQAFGRPVIAHGLTSIVPNSASNLPTKVL